MLASKSFLRRKFKIPLVDWPFFEIFENFQKNCVSNIPMDEKKMEHNCFEKIGDLVPLLVLVNFGCLTLFSLIYYLLKVTLNQF